MKSDTVPTPVRLDRQVKARLRRIASRIGTNSSALMRLATIQFLDEVERTGELRLRTNMEAGK